jgi:superfamily II DNA or RNA helicase
MYVINWFLGPILYKSDTAEKEDSLVRVEYFEYTPEDPTFNDIIYNPAGVMFTSLMINKVVEYAHRNTFIVEVLKDIYEEPERQILVLTDRVQHTKVLYDLLPAEIQQNACVLGRDVKSQQRAEWCATKRILLATYSMCKEGFDVATLNTLLMATSRPDVDQIVGRILRIEKNKRTVDPLILDIVDPAFRRQFQERLQLYKQRNYTIQKTIIDSTP